jgi:hypothetical protein
MHKNADLKFTHKNADLKFTHKNADAKIYAQKCRRENICTKKQKYRIKVFDTNGALAYNIT